MRLARALVLTTLALALAACGGSGSDDAAAGGEGSPLVVYSGRNENLVGPLLQKFTAATGIPVTPRYGDSASLAATLLEEGDRTPAAAFFSQDAGALGALLDAGRLAPLPPAQLDRVPAQYRSADGTWVGLSGRARVLVYNSAAVKAADLPDSVFDLTEPAYRGKVGFAPTNASFQSFVTGMRVAAGEERTRTFLEGFQANQPKAYDGNVSVLDAVEAGEVPYGLVNHYYLYEKGANTPGGLEALKARNHVFAPGDPGALVNVAGIGVLKDKGDARTGRLVDYLLGEEAQRYFAEETKEYPLVAGIPAESGLPPLSSVEGPDVDLSQLDSLQETLSLLEQVGLT